MDLKLALKKVLEEIKKKNNYRDLLNSAFELSLKLQKDNLEACLNNVISDTFEINGIIIIDYLCSSETFTKDDLNLADSGLVNFINEIKFRYGYFLRVSRDRTRNPFGVKEIQASVGAGLSHNTLQISRRDEESLTLSCNAQDLVSLLNAISGMLLNTLSVGVYNLNLEAIKSLIEISKELNSKIEEIIKESSQEEFIEENN